MGITLSLSQRPEPGNRLLKFRGDTITFELILPEFYDGSAWLRTNIGHGGISRQEIMDHIDHDETILNQDWFDIPMTRQGDDRFSIRLPLTEVGHFEAKCFFLPTGSIDPLWPEGANTQLNVEPADTCCGNIIYNAFVRQFGPNKIGHAADVGRKDWIDTLDRQGYTVIPPTGTFRDLIKELDFIMGELGCRIIQLLPIHPTPTTFARMGRFGSPYASLDFTSVDPALAEFDPAATPLEQFKELVDAIHKRNGKILIDIAVNHTGWGAELHETHPEWLDRDPEGRIKMPGAWGVVWEDLAQLDYSHRDLWKYIADVFLTWCKRGVDGFRCDAGYMIPVMAWQYIIACVREQFSDTVFLLEGLGGKISVTRDLLNTAGFNWAYSELFQNYDRYQIEHYLPEAMEISQTDGMMVHFAETHDNLRLAAQSKSYARMRTALCALTAINGGFGFANGVEWFAAQKIVVHEAHGLNWGSADNQVPHIQKLNRLLRNHPAFHCGAEVRLVQHGQGNCLAVYRHQPCSGEKLLILVNLDTEKETPCTWKRKEGLDKDELYDVLTDTFYPTVLSDDSRSCLLKPGQVLCLSVDNTWTQENLNIPFDLLTLPEKIERQQLRAKVLDVLTFFKGHQDVADVDIEDAEEKFHHDPELFCQENNPFSDESLVVKWVWPRDLKREVMVPPKHFLLVLSKVPFRARIIRNGRVICREGSLSRRDGMFFVLFSPLSTPDRHVQCRLKLSVYESTTCRHDEGHLLYLSQIQKVFIKPYYGGERIRKSSLMQLITNGHGAMSRFCVSWGELNSRYDALLAANLNPGYPEDRRIMFSRCRIWLVYQGYSYPGNKECLKRFYDTETGAGIWDYSIPTGQGEHVHFSVKVDMTAGENGVSLFFSRHPKKTDPHRLSDEQPIRLILRPDIEDRNFHETTKAYLGPEHDWPKRIIDLKNGFRFVPSDTRILTMTVSSGNFVREPEWQYMVYRPLEAQRGLDPDSDLFSPGYFSVLLKGGEGVELKARVTKTQEKPPVEERPPSIEDAPRKPPKINLIRSAEKAMDYYVVKRGDLKSVIAGYPWFLDWGRDSLIFARGMIAAKRDGDVKAVLKQFGSFERQGTLPNMIHGEKAHNRDTSDAPLWFCLVCKELVGVRTNEGFLEALCGQRTIREIIMSIGASFSSETPNGIRMDGASGLIYSPSHFTWMDTNHPAGTPRQGYAIEIQALWFSTVKFLSRIDAKNSVMWQALSEKIKSSIRELFLLNNDGYLSDCLYALPGESAKTASPDDALRPNQLLAVTLGAVDDKALCRSVVSSCESLLVPGAIRSLADQPVKRPLEIVHQGRVINTPHAPYLGRYEGDEDTKRKPAYHNGTAWTWMFPLFCEAYAMACGDGATETALALLGSSERLIREGCVGHVPEIVDGDFPHHQRGCDAQAWGCSELYRVLKKLSGDHKGHVLAGDI